MQKVHAIFHGKVQGVFFRANCQEKAVSLRISGWVRNRPDGTVEMKAEGYKEKLQEMVEWCRNSQPYARVDDIDLNWSTGEPEFNGFRILK